MEGLGRAVSGLNAARASIEVAGENIANENTEGYHRKRVSLQAKPGTKSTDLTIGLGVEADSIERVRDELTERSLLANMQIESRLKKTSDLLGKLESYFQEPGENGFDSKLGGIFEGLRALSTNPDDPAQKREVIQKAMGATNNLNRLDQDMTTLAEHVETSLDECASEVNDLTEQIADYNEELFHHEASGDKLTTIRDKRDKAISDLAELTNVKVHTTEEGHKNISVKGALLVSGESSYDVEIAQNGERVEVQALGQAVNVEDGEMGGLLKMTNHFIPKYQDGLDDLANGMRRAFNRLHSTGLGSDGRFTHLEGANAFPENDPLQEQGYDQVPEVDDGKLYVNVEDTETGEVTQHELTGIDTIQGATDLVSDIADELDDVENLSAEENNGRLSINADEGFEFGFATQYDPNPDYSSGDGPEVTVNGAFEGSDDFTYEVEFEDDGTVGEDAIELNVKVTDSEGNERDINRTIPADYKPSDSIDLEDGLSINIAEGGVVDGDTVSFEARKSMDPQGLLDPLGINTMFDGVDAENIHVNGNLAEDPSLLSTSLSESSGDNERVLDMLALEENEVLDSQPLNEFYRNLASDVASERNGKDEQLASLENVVQDLEDARDGISGVSVEEEMMKMMQSQRMYQGLTRYIQSLNTTYDDLLRII